MRQLIIADNQDITKLGFKYALNLTKQDCTILEASNKKELIAALRLHPDAIVVLDYTLFDITSSTELMIVQDRFPLVDWILFSDELSNDLLKVLVYNSQSLSLIYKSCNIDEINKSILAAFGGQCYICNRIRSQLESANKLASNGEGRLLTVTEKEILNQIARGKTTKEIAYDRNLSFHTIITHRKNIFRKLEVNNVHEATKYAMRAGIIDVSDYYI